MIAIFSYAATALAFLLVGYAIGRRRDAKVRGEIARVGAMVIAELKPKEKPSLFAERAFEFGFAQNSFEERLSEVIADDADYDRIGWDYYDNSLEIYGVDDSLRLSEDAQRVISENGFFKVYVNHKDGWETHYDWGKEFKVQRGWRRKRIATGFEISDWPEGWNTPACLDWLKTGYMKIVGDAEMSTSVRHQGASVEQAEHAKQSVSTTPDLLPYVAAAEGGSQPALR